MERTEKYFDWEIAAEGVAEVSVREDVELNAAHIAKALEIVSEKMPEKFCVLAQRHENYRQSLEAMVALSKINSILVYAVYGLNDEQLALAKSHKMINAKVRVFDDKNSALSVCIEAYQNYKQKSQA